MAKLRKFSHTAIEAERGQRLDQVLSARLPASKAKARMLIIAGAVYLNGKRVRIASKNLLPGAIIVAFIDDAKLAAGGPSKDRHFVFMASHIVFEDEWLVAVDKPPGLPTQPTLDEARENLYGALKKFIATRDGAAATYVGLHHRLDRDTSGVILFTKSKAANAKVGQLFSEHLAQKTYVCIVPRAGRRAPPSKQWTVNNFLARTPGKSSRMRSVKSGGDVAHTDFKVIEDMSGLSGGWLIEAKPRTGRMHQIRVHLAEAGLSILGDQAYGAPETEAASRVMLHAANLTFPHPITNLETSVSAPIPEDFNQCLVRLRRNP